jgi:hypothetical protein
MTKINACRLCKSKKIKKLFSLGVQYYTGIFSKINSKVPKGELAVIICNRLLPTSLVPTINNDTLLFVVLWRVKGKLNT